MDALRSSLFRVRKTHTASNEHTPIEVNGELRNLKEKFSNAQLTVEVVNSVVKMCSQGGYVDQFDKDEPNHNCRMITTTM